MNAFKKSLILGSLFAATSLFYRGCDKKYPDYIQKRENGAIEVNYGSYTSQYILDRETIIRVNAGRAVAALKKNKGVNIFSLEQSRIDELELDPRLVCIFTENAKRYSESLEGIAANRSGNLGEQDYALLANKPYSSKINPSDDVPEAFAFPFRDKDNNNKISLFFVYDASWKRKYVRNEEEINLIGRTIVAPGKIGDNLYREVISIDEPGISGLTIDSGDNFIRLERRDLDKYWNEKTRN